MTQTIMTIGEAADRIGCQAWKIRELIKKGTLPEPPRVGVYRVFTEEDLPTIRQALIEAGYLK